MVTTSGASMLMPPEPAVMTFPKMTSPKPTPAFVATSTIPPVPCGVAPPSPSVIGLVTFTVPVVSIRSH